jgi:hypothetical protein
MDRDRARLNERGRLAAPLAAGRLGRRVTCCSSLVSAELGGAAAFPPPPQPARAIARSRSTAGRRIATSLAPYSAPVRASIPPALLLLLVAVAGCASSSKEGNAKQIGPAVRWTAEQPPARPIAPGKQLAFAMQIRVPADAPLGGNGLFWALDPFGARGPQAHARVTVDR